MSAFLDAQTGDPYYTESGGVGYNTDGTYTAPAVYGTPAPVDAGGGAPAWYSQGILDVFKFGVGVWNQNQQQQRMLDYRRYEATQLGLYQQGQSALIYRQPNGQISGSITGLALIGIAAFLLLKG